jgi:hypothetical protein
MLSRIFRRHLLLPSFDPNPTNIRASRFPQLEHGSTATAFPTSSKNGPVVPAARVDSDSEYEGEGPARVQSRPVSKTMTAPEQSAPKRKRASDTSDRTAKRTRVIQSGGSGETGRGSLASGPARGEDDAMDQDSQGEETLEVEQNLFCPSDEDSSTIQQWVAPFHIPSRGFTFL